LNSLKFRDVNAQFQLGYCYYYGIGTKINKTKAFELYKEAAAKGSSTAQVNLGYLYDCGQGVEKDRKKAIYWYQKAAENGNAIALYNLGESYELGMALKKMKLKHLNIMKSLLKMIVMLNFTLDIAI
jgi:TPR repeat protein